MAKVIHYFAHPGLRFSKTNAAMWQATRDIQGVTRVDLYHEYPHRYLDVDKEQQRLRDHDVIVLQFPIYWYSSPSLVKEWIDLVFERGFAYGDGGDELAGKYLILAVSTGGPEEAYTENGYQNYPLRTFLTPFEQTARLSQMTFLAPYVRYSALQLDPAEHVNGFMNLLEALRDDLLDLDAAAAADVLHHNTLPLKEVMLND